jgi:uncharacterized membrane protein YfcA
LCNDRGTRRRSLPSARHADATSSAVVAAVAALAGAVNSVAGGGSLLTYPALVALGVGPVAANATSTVALWPGSLASLWGYRSELAGGRTWVAALAAPSVAGGLAGALLLLWGGDAWFARLVPWLVLGATLLFMLQRPLLVLARGGRGAGARPRRPPMPGSRAGRQRRRSPSSSSSASTAGTSAPARGSSRWRAWGCSG